MLEPSKKILPVNCLSFKLGCSCSTRVPDIATLGKFKVSILFKILYVLGATPSAESIRKFTGSAKATLVLSLINVLKPEPAYVT